MDIFTSFPPHGKRNEIDALGFNQGCGTRFTVPCIRGPSLVVACNQVAGGYVKPQRRSWRRFDHIGPRRARSSSNGKTSARWRCVCVKGMARSNSSIFDWPWGKFGIAPRPRPADGGTTRSLVAEQNQNDVVIGPLRPADNGGRAENLTMGDFLGAHAVSVSSIAETTASACSLDKCGPIGRLRTSLARRSAMGNTPRIQPADR